MMGWYPMLRPEINTVQQHFGSTTAMQENKSNEATMIHKKKKKKKTLVGKVACGAHNAVHRTSDLKMFPVQLECEQERERDGVRDPDRRAGEYVGEPRERRGE